MFGLGSVKIFVRDGRREREASFRPGCLGGKGLIGVLPIKVSFLRAMGCLTGEKIDE